MTAMTAPIGVFDSGLGGLSVLRELTAALPQENFIYLGDIARLPYGTKSPAVVEKYAARCVDFLLGRGVKAIVIACNTATAVALEPLRRQYSVPIFGVIEAGVKAALATTKSGRILVLGTPSTIRSESYPKEFMRQSADVDVVQKACPLLVPLAEEGWYDHPVTVSVIASYLSETRSANVDTLLLGCTHYPLLEPSFRKVLWSEVTLVHGGKTLADDVKGFLQQSQIAVTSPVPGTVRYFATDLVTSSVLSEKFDHADL